MSRPKCTIILTEKARENPLASESNRRAIETDPTSPQPQLTTSSPVPPSSIHGTLESTSATLMATDSHSLDSSPDPMHVSTSASTKRPRPRPLLPTASIQTIPDDETADETPKAKKAKTNSHQAQALQTDASIIVIEDGDDLNEPLNKTQPSADILKFFIEVPGQPGQKKGRMKCELCA